MEIFIPRLIDGVWSGTRFLGLNPDGGGDFLFRPQLEDVRDGATLGRASHLRNLINFFDIGAT